MKIVYITRDIERALGINPNSDFIVITNKTPYSEKIFQKMDENAKENVILIEDEKILNTYELLKDNKVQNFISLKSKADEIGILVFKNTLQIEEICKINNWNLLNPPSSLAEKYENKITQIEWLGELAKYLPKTKIEIAKNIKWEKEPLVIQWAHGHTGDGTSLVNSEKELAELQSKFKDRIARISQFINGPSFTVNVVVTADSILMGNISYQITGLPPFTKNLFSTVGNDWSLTHSLLSDEEISYIETIAKEVGAKMRSEGWRGLFGIDVIRDNERNQIFLIEINARQPASTTYESYLEKSMGNGLTTFEAHLLALQDKNIDGNIIEINDGAQIIQRVTDDIANVSENLEEQIENCGYQTIKYSNIEMNSDLLRIQSKKGIMESHGKLNKRGEEIVKILSDK